MNDIKILIVEDEPVISEYIAECVQQFGYTVSAKCYTVQDAMTECKYHTPDIALLDINLNDSVDGIDLAHHFNKEYDFPIIFITSYTEKSNLDRAKNVNPAAYLIKPFDKDTLNASISLGIHNFSRRINKLLETKKITEEESILSVSESFFIKEKGRYIKVQHRHILWVEASDAYSIIYTNEGRHIVHSSLKGMEEKLDSTKFIRIHRSFIVNLSRVEEVTTDHVSIGDIEVSIGKAYRPQLFNCLNFI